MSLVSAPRTSSEAPKGAIEEREVINVLAGKGPAGKATKINPDENAWEKVDPPQEGRYSLRLFCSDGPEKCTTVNYKTGRNRQPILENGQKVFDGYSINIECRITNAGEDDNAVVFATVSTRIGRGKSISTAAGLLIKLGYEKLFQNGKEYTDLQIAKGVVQALQKEPIIHNNWIDWKASYQSAITGQWKNVCKTMNDFPVNPEGQHESSITVTTDSGGRESLNAKLFVREWGGKGSIVSEAVEPVAVQEEPVAVAAEAPKPKVAPKKAAQPAPEPAPAPVVEELTGEDENELVLE